MELRDYARLLRRYAFLLVNALLVGAILGALVAGLPAVRYSSTSTLAVVGADTDADPDNAYQSQLLAQGRVVTYATVATEPVVLAEAARQVGGGVTEEDVARATTVTVPVNTTLLKVVATDTESVRAQRIVTAVGTALAARVAAVESKAGRSPAVRVAEVQPATVARADPDHALFDELAGAVLLGLAALVVAAIHHHLRGKVLDAHDLARVTSAPVIGPVIRRGGDGVGSDGELRDLATVIVSLGGQHRGPVVLVPASAGALADQLTPRLAAAVGQSGRRVLLVSDAVAETEGISGCSLLQALAGHGVPAPEPTTSGLCVAPLGLTGDGPAPIIDPARLGPVMRELERGGEVAIIDAPPLDVSLDGALLGAAAGTTLLVVEAGRSSRADVGRGLERLTASGAELRGVVLISSRRR